MKKKFFPENFFRSYFRVPYTLSFCQKSEKTNEAILHKVQKTLFLGSFWPKFVKKYFFLKIGLRHILAIAILHLCAKNQKKLMSQSREKLETDERTVERRKRIFRKKLFRSHFRVPCSLSFCQKSEKTNEAILNKSKKPYFNAVFGPNLPKKFFSRKPGSVTFWTLPFCIFVPKIRKNWWANPEKIRK